MNFYGITALINGIACLILGSFVYFKNRKRAVNKTFIILSLSASFWSGSYFIWQLATDKPTALFWVRVLMAGAILISITLFHYTIVWLNIYKERKKILIFGYILALIF